MSKGFDFERGLCHRLSKWWMGDPDYDDVVFWRTPCSGGQATARAKQGKRTTGRHGDIAATDERGRPFTSLFLLEAKRGYNRATVHDLLDKPKTGAIRPYEEWLDKLLAKCELLRVPYWLLIHKRDRHDEMVFMPADACSKLGLESMVRIDYKGELICGLRLATFLTQVDRESVEGRLASALLQGAA